MLFQEGDFEQVYFPFKVTYSRTLLLTKYL